MEERFMESAGRIGTRRSSEAPARDILQIDSIQVVAKVRAVNARIAELGR